MSASVALVGAHILFLWMFLAADPLDQRGAFEHAAMWRHGMAGNSPLYMPGFFAVACVTWIWARARSRQQMLLEGLLVLVAAILVARSAVPASSWHATVIATYTLLTWSVFIVASQHSLAQRSLRPFIPVLLMTSILIEIRPWTVGDFTHLWWTRVTEGHPAAVMSVVIWSTPLAVVFARLRSSGRRKQAPAR